LYLILALMAIFILWVWFERGESFRKYSIENKEVWVCDICSYTYVDSQHDAISRCPQCESLNHKR
jgi:rubrerythrin